MAFYSCTEENRAHTTRYLKRACVCVFVYKCVFRVQPGPAWPGLATEALQGCRVDKKGAEVERGEGLQ